MAAEKLDRIDVVETNLRKLIALKPDHAQAYNALGYTLADRTDRLKEAKGYIEKALKLRRTIPSSSTAWAGCCIAWATTRKALEYLQRAYAQRPDPEIAAHIGEVLWARGQQAGRRKDLARRLQGQSGQRDAAGDHEALPALNRGAVDVPAIAWWCSSAQARQRPLRVAAFCRVSHSGRTVRALLSACATRRARPYRRSGTGQCLRAQRPRQRARREQMPIPAASAGSMRPSADEVWLYSPLGSAVAHMRQDAPAPRSSLRMARNIGPHTSPSC